MKLSDLTDYIFLKIVKIYDKTVGGYGLGYLFPGEVERIKSELKYKGYAERRFGSKITIHSKLLISLDGENKKGEPLIFFEFSANWDPLTPEGIKIEEKLIKGFNNAVELFLKKRGLLQKK